MILDHHIRTVFTGMKGSRLLFSDFDLATKILLHCLPPNSPTLIEMHLGHVASFQAINSFGELFAQSFIFDVLDGVQIGLEGKDKSFRIWEAM
jgi:hypothetical protein